MAVDSETESQELQQQVALQSSMTHSIDSNEIFDLCLLRQLFLKPHSRIQISVQLPLKASASGFTPSNWDIIESLKALVLPQEFICIKPIKSAPEYVRFEGEVAARSELPVFINLLDNQSIKFSGCPEPLKVHAAQAKLVFPAKNDWELFFQKPFNELKPGERPDTVLFRGLPVRWFTENDSSEESAPSETVLSRAFGIFGDVRRVEIVVTGKDGSADGSATEAESVGPTTVDEVSGITFSAYVQYVDYMGFLKAMDALRGKKLLRKVIGDDSTPRYQEASITVDFDKSKYMSDRAITKRKYERDKEELLNKARQIRLEQQRNEESERDERMKRTEHHQELQREEQRRRWEQEQQQRAADERRRLDEEAMARRIALEERKIIIAQRKLESIRLLTVLFERIKIAKMSDERERRILEQLVEAKKQLERERQAEEQRRLMAIQRELEVKEEEDLLRKKIMQRLVHGKSGDKNLEEDYKRRGSDHEEETNGDRAAKGRVGGLGDFVPIDDEISGRRFMNFPRGHDRGGFYRGGGGGGRGRRGGFVPSANKAPLDPRLPGGQHRQYVPKALRNMLPASNGGNRDMADVNDLTQLAQKKQRNRGGRQRGQRGFGGKALPTVGPSRSQEDGRVKKLPLPASTKRSRRSAYKSPNRGRSPMSRSGSRSGSASSSYSSASGSYSGSSRSYSTAGSMTQSSPEKPKKKEKKGANAPKKGRQSRSPSTSISPVKKKTSKGFPLKTGRQSTSRSPSPPRPLKKKPGKADIFKKARSPSMSRSPSPPSKKKSMKAPPIVSSKKARSPRSMSRSPSPSSKKKLPKGLPESKKFRAPSRSTSRSPSPTSKKKVSKDMYAGLKKVSSRPEEDRRNQERERSMKGYLVDRQRQRMGAEDLNAKRREMAKRFPSPVEVRSKRLSTGGYDEELEAILAKKQRVGGLARLPEQPSKDKRLSNPSTSSNSRRGGYIEHDLDRARNSGGKNFGSAKSSPSKAAYFNAPRRDDRHQRGLAASSAGKKKPGPLPGRRPMAADDYYDDDVGQSSDRGNGGNGKKEPRFTFYSHTAIR